MKKNQRAVRACIAPFLGRKPKGELFSDFSLEDWEAFYHFARKHNIELVLLEGIAQEDREKIPKEIRIRLEQKARNQIMHFYCMFNFTMQVTDLFLKNKIAGIVLKGVTLSGLYPKEELRYFGDVDFFIPDKKEYKKACMILEKEGYQLKKDDDKEHYAYIGIEGYSKNVCYLELHNRISDDVFGKKRENIADRIFGNLSTITTTQEVMGSSLLKLKVTEDAAYELLHMAKHFRRGIGLRQMLDWVFLLTRVGEEIEREKFLSYLKKLGILKFGVTITYCAIESLGLPKRYYNLLFSNMPLPDKKVATAFMEDIFLAGEFGRAERTRITKRHHGAKNLLGYFKELQQQTKMLYPSYSKVFILLPFLWILSFARFVKVMTVERKINLKETFLTFHRREKLQGYLNLFEQEGKKT